MIRQIEKAQVNNRKAMKIPGGLAQLARAPSLHAGGQRFESVILHQSKPNKRVWLLD